MTNDLCLRDDSCCHEASCADSGLKGERRSSTVSGKLTARERAIADRTAGIGWKRPLQRGDCLEGGMNEARPCPFVGCKWHLYLDVNPDTGSIKLNFPDSGVEDLRDSCALDIASDRGTTLERVGEAMNITRERVRQVEQLNLARLLINPETQQRLG